MIVVQGLDIAEHEFRSVFVRYSHTLWDKNLRAVGVFV